MASVVQDDLSLLDAALQGAHLPSLLMSLVHLTGHASLLSDEFRPAYGMQRELERLGGYSPEVANKLRARAGEALRTYLAGDKPLPPPPDAATLRRMIDFIAGTQVPDAYVDMLVEELDLQLEDARRPQWREPELIEMAARSKAIVIGAGMSGLLAGIRLSQAGVDVELIEKNADVGGTWFENSYPGCRVDNPSHLYSYSFEANHHWPFHYSTQPVLQRYFRECAETHELDKRIRFDTQVRRAEFDVDAGQWRVTVAGKDGAEEVLTADFVVSAVGQLNQPNYPSIPGRDCFGGPSFHSARWNHEVSLKGKRVAVVGSGLSAIQFVPEIAREAEHVTVFQRSPTWLGRTDHYHQPVPPAEQWLLEHAPYYGKWYRFRQFWVLTDGGLPACRRDPAYTGPPTAVSDLNAMMREFLLADMRAQVDGDEELLARITPSYPPSGKRVALDNGAWIAALKRPNVSLVTEPIREITETGVVSADDTAHEADVLIFATGFTASDFLSTFEVIGKDGQSLHDVWQGDARAYLGLLVPGFPNFFMLYGPNTNIVANGSIIFFSECGARYVVGALELLGRTGNRTLEVRGDVHDRFNAMIDEANSNMAWGAPQVSSWYKNATGRVSQNWPLRLVDYWSATSAPKAEDLHLG